MRHKVVLMEELGTLGRLWDESLRLADVADDDATDVVVELLSCELEFVVGSQLFFSKLS